MARKPAFKPAAQYQITRLETVRILADPLRLRLIEVMATRLDEPWTVKELARTLGEPTTKLYYHVNLLEEHGILVVTGSRVVSGIVEKRYQVVAGQIGIDRTILSATDSGVDEALHGILSTLFATAEQDIQAAVRSGIASLHGGHDADEREPVILSKSVDRLSPARATEFRERLRALIAEFEPGAGSAERSPDDRLYGLVLAFYPMAEVAATTTARARTRTSAKETSR